MRSRHVNNFGSVITEDCSCFIVEPCRCIGRKTFEVVHMCEEILNDSLVVDVEFVEVFDKIAVRA